MTTETKQLKVFAMDDSSWVAHYSEGEAKKFYLSQVGMDEADFDEYYEGEVPLTNTMFWPAEDVNSDEAEKLGFERHVHSPYGDCYLVTFDWVIKHFSQNYPGWIAMCE